MHNSDAVLFEIMKTCFRKVVHIHHHTHKCRLNIKGHVVGRQKQLIYGPGDIECHRGLDKRIYIVDTGKDLVSSTIKFPKRAYVALKLHLKFRRSEVFFTIYCDQSLSERTLSL